MKTSRKSSHILLSYLLILFLTQCPFTQTSSMLTTQPTSLGVHMVRSPEAVVAPKGDEAIFECELNLTPESLQWRFRRANSDAFEYLKKADSYSITNDEGASKLRVYVGPEMEGEYQCVAWFGSSAISSVTANLTLAAIRIDVANANTRNLSRWTVAPRNTIIIRCGKVVSNPPAVWNFYKNNQLISQSENKIVAGGMVLSAVTPADSGIYSCSAVNAITSEKIQLPQKIDLRVETTGRTPPHFLIDAQTEIMARPNQTITLECAGVGHPKPEPVWSSPDVQNMTDNRKTILPYGLQIVNIVPQDRGTYICRLDNGISPPLVQVIKLKVMEKPTIMQGPQATLTNEGGALELDCAAGGYPEPRIYWLINGKDTKQDNETLHEGSKLIIRHVQKRHAGIVQCFARNDAGETNEGNLLQVNPKQIQGEIGSQPLGSFPTKSTYDHPGKQRAKKKHKMVNMVPPSRPNVTRLSDESVMLRWYVPRNEGLPIQFFKVQYRMLGDITKTAPRENWQTTNEDIPYGKRDRNYEGMKNFTSSVPGLKPDRFYRFRIIAVYSNNDNKEGNSSGKFLLQRGSALGPSRSHLPAPKLVTVEGVSETEILLHWELPLNRSNSVEGFYAYYRPASTAGEYLKATVDGMRARKFKIDMLESGTLYEFKLQSFTASAASDFSAIVTGRTQKPPTPPPVVTTPVIPPTKANEEDNSLYPVVVGATCGGLLLLVAIFTACFCVKRRKGSSQEDEDKPQIDHIQADFNQSVMASHHKTSHRINGVMPRMNITPNPMAQEGDKNRNVMELRFMPPTTGGMSPVTSATTTTTTTTTTAAAPTTPAGHQHPPPLPPLPSSKAKTSPPPPPGGVASITTPPNKLHPPNTHHHSYNLPPQAPPANMMPPPLPPHQHQQNNNHQYQQPPPPMHYPPMTPTLEAHRRTLERSARNLHYPSDNAADGLPTRIPSLRRTRHNNGGVGIPIVPGSPRVQRSPMPARAMMKRNRLGSHTENMSSGSLNSIEV